MLTDREARQVYNRALMDLSCDKLQGNYNQITIVQMDDCSYVVRMPIARENSVYPVDIDFSLGTPFENYQNYAVIQQALHDPEHSLGVAELYHLREDGAAIFEFINGQKLMDVAPWGTAFPKAVIDAIPKSLFRACRINVEDLNIPNDWPACGDTSGYGQRLVEHAARYTEGIWQGYGKLLNRLGVKEQPFAPFHEFFSQMKKRKFIAYTGDFHRDNVIISNDRKTAFLFDLDLWKYGDLCSELAILKCRSLLPDKDFSGLVKEIVRILPEEYTDGIEQDLPKWLAFEDLRETVSNTKYHVEQMMLQPDHRLPKEAFALFLNPARQRVGESAMDPDLINRIFINHVKEKKLSIQVKPNEVDSRFLDCTRPQLLDCQDHDNPF